MKASWTIIQGFQKSPSAAPTSVLCYLHGNLRSNVPHSSPALRFFNPTQPCGQRKIQILQGRGESGDNMVLQKALGERPDGFQNSITLQSSFWKWGCENALP